MIQNIVTWKLSKSFRNRLSCTLKLIFPLPGEPAHPSLPNISIPALIFTSWFLRKEILEKVEVKRRRWVVKNASFTRLLFKIRLWSSKKNCVICLFIESPIKIMKNTFYFISKVLFVLLIFKFFHDFLDMLEKRLD